MTIQASLFSLDQNPEYPARIGTYEFDAVPAVGDIIYRHDGMRQPYELMFKVVQVVHDVSVGARGIELYVLSCSKLEFRELLVQRALSFGR